MKTSSVLRFETYELLFPYCEDSKYVGFSKCYLKCPGSSNLYSHIPSAAPIQISFYLHICTNCKLNKQTNFKKYFHFLLTYFAYAGISSYIHIQTLIWCIAHLIISDKSISSDLASKVECEILSKKNKRKIYQFSTKNT